MTSAKLFRPHKVAALIVKDHPDVTDATVESSRREGTFRVTVYDGNDGLAVWTHDTGLPTDDVADVLASLLAEELNELGIQTDVL